MNLPRPFCFAQVSDLHLFADPKRLRHGFDTNALTLKVLGKVKDVSPDLIIFSGDMADLGEREAYLRLGELRKRFFGNIPCYWLEGNHDDSLVMQEVAGKTGFLSEKSFKVEGVRFLLLNSLNENNPAFGCLGKDELVFFHSEIEKIKAANERVFVFLHHQPIDVSSPWLQKSMLHDAKEFLKILTSVNENLLGVGFGHIHFAGQWDLHKIRFFSSPAACFQFQTGTDSFALSEKRPGFRLFRLTKGFSLSSEVIRA